MASVATAPRPARYGSAADLADYSGLSTKTVRRLVESGAVRGLKVGRRLLIPFEDLDRHILGRSAPGRPHAMAIAPTPSSTATIDLETGRLLPLTDEQRRARSAALARALDEIDTITDETPGAQRSGQGTGGSSGP